MAWSESARQASAAARGKGKKGGIKKAEILLTNDVYRGRMTHITRGKKTKSYRPGKSSRARLQRFYEKNKARIKVKKGGHLNVSSWTKLSVKGK